MCALKRVSSHRVFRGCAFRPLRPSSPAARCPPGHPQPQALHGLGDDEGLDATGEGQAQGKQRCFMAVAGVVLLSSGGKRRAESVGLGPYTGGGPASQPRLGPRPHSFPESPLAHPRALRQLPPPGQ